MKAMAAISMGLGVALAAFTYPSSAHAEGTAPVIEVVTLTLRKGVTPAQFDQVDREVQVDYISKRKGFLSRESAPGGDNKWLVVVHWQSVADADASMKSFSTAHAASAFMAMVEPNSMVMTRYGR